MVAFGVLRLLAGFPVTAAEKPYVRMSLNVVPLHFLSEKSAQLIQINCFMFMSRCRMILESFRKPGEIAYALFLCGRARTALCFFAF